MTIFEIISAIVLIIACVFIVIVVLMQDTKTQMSKTISGGSGDNYFGKNSGRTKEARLNRAMTAAAVVFFVLAIVVNVANVYFGRKTEDNSSVTSSVVSDAGSDTDSDVTVTAENDTESNTESGNESNTESGAVSE